MATFLVSAGALAAVLPYHYAAAPGDFAAPVVPASGLVGCPGMAGFNPAATTAGSATAEEADTPAAAVLRQELYYSGLPQRGWRLVVDLLTEKWYGVRTPGGLGFAEAGVKLGSGVWVPGAFGPCEARAVPPAGYSTSTWAFASSPDRSSVDLYLRVQPQPCGGSPDRTAVAVSLEADSTAVVVTAYLRTTGTPSERICTGSRRSPSRSESTCPSRWEIARSRMAARGRPNRDSIAAGSSLPSSQIEARRRAHNWREPTERLGRRPRQ